MDPRYDWDDYTARTSLDRYILDYMKRRNLHTAAAVFASEARVTKEPVAIDGFLSDWWDIFWDFYSSRGRKDDLAVSKELTSVGKNVINNQEICINQNQQLASKNLVNTNTGSRLRPPAAPPSLINFNGNIRPSNDFPKAFAQASVSPQLPVETNSVRMMGLTAGQFPARRLLSSAAPKIVDSSLQSYDPRRFLLEQSSTLNARLHRPPHANIAQGAEQSAQGAEQSAQGTEQGAQEAEQGAQAIYPRLERPPAAGVKKSDNISPSKRMRISDGSSPSKMNFHVENSLPAVLVPRGKPLPKFFDDSPHTPENMNVSPQGSSNASTTPENTDVSPEGSINDATTMTPENYELSGQEGHINVVMEEVAEAPVKVARRRRGWRHTKGQLRLRQQSSEDARKRECSQHILHKESDYGGNDAEVDKPVDKDDEVIESFLCHNVDDEDDANGTSNSLSNLQQNLSDFSFQEHATFDTSKNKVLCCHFSSDGKLLAGAGHDKMVSVWDVDSLSHICSIRRHSNIITDVRFKPHSTVFATSSFDTTVLLWDAANVSKLPVKLQGHVDPVMSIDFHPKRPALICSCDLNGEVRLWSINQLACIHLFKIHGASGQVRFQPQGRNWLAAASGNTIQLLDIETDMRKYLKGHAKDVRSICWHPSGTYLASVSEDSARLWLPNSEKCAYELHSSGNKFQSCTFHPSHPLTLVIGGYQIIELWNFIDGKKTLTIQAHDGIISALADSTKAKLIASASHDHSLKLWRQVI